MCNLSELGEERGIKKGITQERIAAVERMLKANATKEQIISFGYTEEEIERAESRLYANIQANQGAVKIIVELGQEYGLDDGEILRQMQEIIGVSSERAKGYLQQYGKQPVQINGIMETIRRNGG